MRYRLPLLAAGRQVVTRVRRGGAAWLWLPILLHACAGGEVVPVEATCPDTLLVAEASRLVVHAEQDDPAGHVASIAGLRWSCTFLPESHRVRLTAHLEILVTTTPREVSQDVSFPLFVALEDREGRIGGDRLQPGDRSGVWLRPHDRCRRPHDLHRFPDQSRGSGAVPDWTVSILAPSF